MNIDPNEAVRKLRNMVNQNHFTIAEIIEYNKYKNIIEDAIVNGGYILVKEDDCTAQHNDKQS